jgi:hypothetical protein
MRRKLSVFLLSACLLVPLALKADDHDRRYYDRDRRDYHTWNNQEDRAYRVYLVQQHRVYRDFYQERRNRQMAYFRWRHRHSDAVLFRVEVR